MSSIITNSNPNSNSNLVNGQDNNSDAPTPSVREDNPLGTQYPRRLRPRRGAVSLHDGDGWIDNYGRSINS